VTGKVLGNYEIPDKLGVGGMGEVWRARFELEARALGALNHPNVMAIYDVGEDGGRAYIVSELVEGEPLRAVLDHGPLPVRCREVGSRGIWRCRRAAI
jgi:serine/threonine protein kinase